MLRGELERIDSIPTLPEIVTRILGMIDDPTVSAYQLAAVISRDQSLVASVLRLVNSAYYGLRSRVTSVGRAVVLLGLGTIRNMVLAATLMNAFGEGRNSGGLNRKSLWRHSIATATAARLLAERTGLLPPEDAFLAGLVHDIGRLVMDQYFPAELAEILRRLAENEGVGAREVEEEILGADHAELGRLVAEKWSLPPVAIRGIGYHHGPESEGWDTPGALVHASDLLAHAAGLGAGIPGRLPGPSRDALEVLGLREDDLERMVPEVARLYRDSNVLLDILG